MGSRGAVVFISFFPIDMVAGARYHTGIPLTAPQGQKAPPVTKNTAKQLMDILAHMSRHISDNTMPTHPDHGEMASVSADLLDYDIMRLQQIIEAASETPEEREEREEREDLGEEALYRG
jgi:hypothetical protein